MTSFVDFMSCTPVLFAIKTMNVYSSLVTSPHIAWYLLRDKQTFKSYYTPL